MYQPSDLFKKAYGYAVKHYDLLAILSAKYGLLLPDEVIEPYDLTLNVLSEEAQRKWAETVLSQLTSKLQLADISAVYFHAGAAYRRHLVELLSARGIRCLTPLEGLDIGQQMAWYLVHT
jgi:hypothetical protein